jgi:hypothetical protein
MTSMQRFAAGYIRRAKLAGVLYCVIPALVWFAVAMWLIGIPFREVYLLRLGLSVVVGGGIAAWLHEYGVKLWLTKHRSADGPATVVDGALIGSAIGLGIQILPALTAVIGTNHPEDAKTTIIIVWLVSIAVGAIIGSVLASVWGRFVSRSPEKG